MFELFSRAFGVTSVSKLHWASERVYTQGALECDIITIRTIFSSGVLLVQISNPLIAACEINRSDIGTEKTQRHNKERK